MSFYGNGKGYIRKSMSVNAHEAYLNEEMPASKWSKSVLVDLALNTNESLSESFLKKVSLKDLRAACLKETAWHHTGAFYKVTYFYTFDEEKVLKLSNSILEDFIETRKAYLEASKTERKEIAAFRKAKKDERKAKEEKEAEWLKLFPYASQKTEGGFLRACEAGKIDFEKLNNLRKEDYLKKIEVLEKNIKTNSEKLRDLDSKDLTKERKAQLKASYESNLNHATQEVEILKKELETF
ncbi:hypothetical protein E4O04_09045 [Treponema sp. OMZ 799]|uniref:hypothetical protein n=1 Tax=Treponema sp. OMZ 799 TaxID=2563668 RepID=UPI0020A438F3|nr:hypothetical protein [Treponema sp. OMZ 799]UTC78138.1 hypothetical protein E4O04_09045 [Treponema sp. OMZ 799]